MKNHLYEQWWNQAVSYSGEFKIEEQEDGTYRFKDGGDRVVKHYEFNPSEIRGPGVYSDDSEGIYTIILPRDIMTLELCQEWIEELNQEFGTEFELIDPEKELEDFNTTTGDNSE